MNLMTKGFRHGLLSAVVFGLLLLTSCSEEKDAEILNLAPQNGGPSTPSDQKIMSCSECTFIVPPGTKVIDGKVEGFKPGDVICLSSAQQYHFLSLKNINGTAAKPITVRNCDGIATIHEETVAYALRFESSKHYRLTGGDNPGEYGIKITGSPSNGVVMGYLTSDFEVDHLEVSNVGFAGIMAKTDPSCDDATIRGNYTMRNVSFHDNYIHDSHGEGFYIGHSSYSGKETTCGMRMPHIIENVKVYRNIVKNSGWDGIQLSSAPHGAEIYENVIENFATDNKAAQRSGICIGGGTGGACYNNLIKNGNGSGIQALGTADNTIHNNIVIGATTFGIFCDERTSPGNGYRILQNTVINAGKASVLIYAEKVPNNEVLNNIFIQEGVDNTLESNFIQVLSKEVKMESVNNFFGSTITDLHFKDPSQANFQLTDRSPVIDKGADVSRFKLVKDFYSKERLKGLRYDIGASEF